MDVTVARGTARIGLTINTKWVVEELFITSTIDASTRFCSFCAISIYEGRFIVSRSIALTASSFIVMILGSISCLKARAPSQIMLYTSNHYLIDHLTNEMKPAPVYIRPLLATCCIIDLYLLQTVFSKADKEGVMLPKAAVVCVLLALFSGSQGSKEANIYNHHLAARKEKFLRFVGQPAVFPKDSETTCLRNSDEYYRRLDLLLCDEKYIRAVFNEIETSNCINEYYNDTTLFYGCGTNDNGDECAGIDDNMHHDFHDRCYKSFHTSNCSSECQTELRQLSDSVGCCIHHDYYLRRPSVWMNCDIEQPEVCADAPNTADILAKKRNIDLCTEKCSLRQDYYVYCKNLGEEYEKLNRECGMDNGESNCGFYNGEFCVTMDLPNSYFETIFYECYNASDSTDVCSTNCRNVLGEFIDTVGCCFHYFNSSISYKYPGLSYDLFSACGIEVPDACKSFNSTAVPDDFLECVGRTINTSGAALPSGVYSIGLIIISLIGTYIY